MKQKKALLILVIALILLLAAASILYQRLADSNESDRLVVQETPPISSEPAPEEPAVQEETPSQEVPTATAPDFMVYDRDGNEVRLSDYFGKPIVLNFWASWCGPCQMEMPGFEEAYQELGDQVHFLMINMTDGSRETVETASQFIEGEGYTFPIYFDRGYEAAIAYSAFSLPTTVFIDAEGIPITQAVGAINGDVLRQGIDMILP